MEKASRPVRNRRHSRRAWPPGDIHRPQKRLFTPDIKRMLKDWLVRRRENPYPSREEKKALAIQTGLTYIQICNWFANWRRKLKNAGREPQKKTWGHLIKNYNTSANGNVEQFSICSSDSIWGDEERSPLNPYEIPSMRSSSNHQQSPEYNSSFNTSSGEYYDRYGELVLKKNKCIDNISDEQKDKNFQMYNYYINTPDRLMDQNYHESKRHFNNAVEQCFQISSTTNNSHMNLSTNISFENYNNCVSKQQQQQCPKSSVTGGGVFSNVKYKNNIMEKYLRGLDCSNNNKDGGLELSKWLESTANFTPDKNNYIEWDTVARNKAANCKLRPTDLINHQKEELEAAEVLTSLAGNYRNRMVNIINNNNNTNNNYNNNDTSIG